VLPDLLCPGLSVLFVGTSVGQASARAGHYHASPTNRLWDLDANGLTDAAGITSERDFEVLKHGIGITDLVARRAASSDSLLADYNYDVAGFLARIEQNRPNIVAFNGRQRGESRAPRRRSDETSATGQSAPAHSTRHRVAVRNSSVDE
jgi:TDG/mug DNA glycosylase family protein